MRNLIIVALVLLIILMVVFIRTKNKDTKTMRKFGIGFVVIALIAFIGMMDLKTGGDNNANNKSLNIKTYEKENKNDSKTDSNEQKEKSKTNSLQDIQVEKQIEKIDNIFNNTDLSSLKTEDIFAKYSDSKKEELNKIFGKDFSPEKNFALSLIGKTVVSFSLKDVNDKIVKLNDKEILLFLDNKENSNTILKNISKFPESTKLIFPSLNKEETKKVIKDYKLEKYTVISEENNRDSSNDLKQITAFVYNTTAVPTMIAQDKNIVTFAENNFEKVDAFLEYSFKEPYFFSK